MNTPATPKKKKPQVITVTVTYPVKPGMTIADWQAEPARLKKVADAMAPGATCKIVFPTLTVTV